jgi:hypothetical protein
MRREKRKKGQKPVPGTFSDRDLAEKEDTYTTASTTVLNFYHALSAMIALSFQLLPDASRLRGASCIPWGLWEVLL